MQWVHFDIMIKLGKIWTLFEHVHHESLVRLRKENKNSFIKDGVKIGAQEDEVIHVLAEIVRVQ